MQTKPQKLSNVTKLILMKRHEFRQSSSVSSSSCWLDLTFMFMEDFVSILFHYCASLWLHMLILWRSGCDLSWKLLSFIAHDNPFSNIQLWGTGCVVFLFRNCVVYRRGLLLFCELVKLRLGELWKAECLLFLRSQDCILKLLWSCMLVLDGEGPEGALVLPHTCCDLRIWCIWNWSALVMSETWCREINHLWCAATWDDWAWQDLPHSSLSRHLLLTHHSPYKVGSIVQLKVLCSFLQQRCT